MDFYSVFLFLFVYYIRPQEWIPIFASVRPVKLVMIIAILALVTRPRGVKLRDFFQTPHDWLMFAFFVHIIVTSGDMYWTFMDVMRFIVFYIVICQALTNINRIQYFLIGWSVMIGAVAALALLSEHGFDPTASYDVTHYFMGNRLVLNTSIFDNPNALGHSVIPLVLMMYYQFFWRRPIFVKEMVAPFFALPLYCIYLTKSKGAFVSGFATYVAGLVFGRPRIVQVSVLVLAATVGMGAVYKLPRMDDLSSSEEGIQGRLHAFTYGYEQVRNSFTGLGYLQWHDSIEGDTGRGMATHSGYNQIGSELGSIGLFLYLGIMYVNARTLFFARTNSESEERVRRILFVLVISFGLSSWMIDWGFRATYFMIAGVVAAFHRLLLRPASRRSLSLDDEVMLEAEERRRAFKGLNKPVAEPAPALALSDGGSNSGKEFSKGQAAFSRRGQKSSEAMDDVVKEEVDEKSVDELAGARLFGDNIPSLGSSWNRLGFLDYVAMFGLLMLAFATWEFVITNEF